MMASVPDLETRCRLCAVPYSRNNQRVDTGVETTMEIVEALLDIVQIESKRLGGSEIVCSRCWRKIIGFKSFVETCRAAQEQLLTDIFLEECPVPEDEDERVDELPSDHAYFLKLNKSESKLSPTDDDVDEPFSSAGTEGMERYLHRLLAEKQCDTSYETNGNACSDCSEEFSSRVELLNHRKTCARIGTADSVPYGLFSCTLCKFTSRSSAAFHLHLMRLHGGDAPLLRVANQSDSIMVSPSENNYPRELELLRGEERAICSDQIVTQHGQRNHQRAHSYILSVDCSTQPSNDSHKRCGVCEKIFRSASLCRAHMKYHFQQKDVVCETCGKRFYSKTDLREHREAEHEHKRYVCNICGLQIKLRSNVKRHLRTHDIAQQFQCDRCPKRFSCRTNLRYHTDLHMGKMRYRCGSCGEAFKYSYTRNQHLYHSHGILVAGVRLRKERKRAPTTAASGKDSEAQPVQCTGRVANLMVPGSCHGYDTTLQDTNTAEQKTVPMSHDHDDLIEYDPFYAPSVHDEEVM